MASNLEVVISATDRFTGTANRVIGTLGRMDTAAGRVGKGVGQLGMGLGRVGLIAAGAAATGLAGIAKATINWETALAGVNKTMDLTPAQLQEVGGQIRNLATTIPLSATAIAGLVEQAGALGIAKDDVVEFARVAATIGVTTNVSADQAATSLGVMSNLLGLTGEEYERFASTLVDLGNKGASTEQQILAIAERAAGAGATIGLSAEQILGFSSAVANLGIEPEAGGSSLQRVFFDTAKLVSAGGAELEAFAATAGMTGEQVKKLFAEDAAGTLEKFVDGLAKLSTDDRLKVLDALGWDDVRVGRMLTGLAEAEQNADNLSKSLNTSASAWSANTAAAEEADKRYGTVSSKITLLKNQAIEAALVVGEGFLPALGRTADKLKTILADPASRADLKGLGEDIGALIDKIDWRKVIDGAKTMVDMAKTLLGVISQIPLEITAAVVAFGGINSLSGGLIGSGISNIVGGLAGAGARGVAAKLPGVGALFAQPVFVTNWPLGGLGGGGVIAGGGGMLGKAMSLILPVGIGLMIGEALGPFVAPALMDLWNNVHQTTRDTTSNGTIADLGRRRTANAGGMSPDERQEANDQKRKIDAVRAAMNNQGRNITNAINRLDMRVTVPVTVKVGGSYTRQTSTSLIRIGSGGTYTGGPGGPVAEGNLY